MLRFASDLVFIAQIPEITDWLTPVWLLSVGIGLGFVLSIINAGETGGAAKDSSVQFRPTWLDEAPCLEPATGGGIYGHVSGLLPVAIWIFDSQR